MFPIADQRLNTSIYQQAIASVASGRDMDGYRSIVDFLFCGLYPEYEASCNRFCDEAGPQLRNFIESEEIRRYEHQMSVALDVALDLHKRGRRISWEAFRQRVTDEAVAAAAT